MARDHPPTMQNNDKLRIAVTGGTGLVGDVLREGFGDRFDARWLSREDADVTDLGAVERAFADTDAVVHLAAAADVGSTWDEVLPANLIGAYNVYEAAVRRGVRRVVFASSNHAMGMYMWDDDRFADPQHPDLVPADAPVRPDTLYGASKVWGEALGRFYAERHGLEVVCLRIGWVTATDRLSPEADTASRLEPPKVARRAPGMWLSHRDCVSLVEASLTAQVEFVIAHGVSDTTGRWLGIESAEKALGWHPRDTAPLPA